VAGDEFDLSIYAPAWDALLARTSNTKRTCCCVPYPPAARSLRFGTVLSTAVKQLSPASVFGFRRGHHERMALTADCRFGAVRRERNHGLRRTNRPNVARLGFDQRHDSAACAGQARPKRSYIVHRSALRQLEWNAQLSCAGSRQWLIRRSAASASTSGNRGWNGTILRSGAGEQPLDCSWRSGRKTFLATSDAARRPGLIPIWPWSCTTPACLALSSALSPSLNPRHQATLSRSEKHMLIEG
jgi:hypothetical protein